MYETKPGIDWQLRPVAAKTTVLRSTTATWVFFGKAAYKLNVEINVKIQIAATLPRQQVVI